MLYFLSQRTQTGGENNFAARAVLFLFSRRFEKFGCCTAGEREGGGCVLKYPRDEAPRIGRKVRGFYPFAHTYRISIHGLGVFARWKENIFAHKRSTIFLKIQSARPRTGGSLPFPAISRRITWDTVRHDNLISAVIAHIRFLSLSRDNEGDFSHDQPSRVNFILSHKARGCVRWRLYRRIKVRLRVLFEGILTKAVVKSRLSSTPPRRLISLRS